MHTFPTGQLATEPSPRGRVPQPSPPPRPPCHVGGGGREEAQARSNTLHDTNGNTSPGITEESGIPVRGHRKGNLNKQGRRGGVSCSRTAVKSEEGSNATQRFKPHTDRQSMDRSASRHSPCMCSPFKWCSDEGGLITDS